MKGASTHRTAGRKTVERRFIGRSFTWQFSDPQCAKKLLLKIPKRIPCVQLAHMQSRCGFKQLRNSLCLQDISLLKRAPTTTAATLSEGNNWPSVYFIYDFTSRVPLIEVFLSLSQALAKSCRVFIHSLSFNFVTFLKSKSVFLLAQKTFIE